MIGQISAMDASYLNATQDAQKYSISEKTIRNWIAQKLLPVREVRREGHRNYHIAPTDIQTLLAAKGFPKKQHYSPSQHTVTGIYLAQREETLEQITRRL